MEIDKEMDAEIEIVEKKYESVEEPIL